MKLHYRTGLPNAQGVSPLPNLPAEQVPIKHVEVVFYSLQLVGVGLVEWQAHAVMKALLPWRSTFAPEYFR